MPSNFFNTLDRKSPKFASVWRSVTGDHPEVTVNADMVDKILFATVSDLKHKKLQDIDSGTVDALEYFLMNARLTPQANADALQILTFAYEHGSFSGPGNDKPASGPVLNDVFQTLYGSSIYKINFVGLYSRFRYAPIDYITIANLIQMGDIKVFEEHGNYLFAFVTADWASYNAKTNELTLKPVYDQSIKNELIIHEATHAILDWNDFNTTTYFSEADAWICGCVYAQVVGRKNGTQPVYLAAYEAAKFVVNGSAVDTDKGWIKAYDNVLGEVKKIYHGKSTRTHFIEKHGHEKATFNNMMAFSNEISEGLRKIIMILGTGVAPMPKH